MEEQKWLNLHRPDAHGLSTRTTPGPCCQKRTKPQNFTLSSVCNRDGAFALVRRGVPSSCLAPSTQASRKSRMADRFPPPPMKATQEQMDAADVPYHYRDYCAHLYIDYKECRLTSGFSWRSQCHHQLHSYNKCEYKEFKRRVAIAIEEKRRRGLLKI